MIVLTIGTFDLLHVGHLELLRECRRMAGISGTVVAAVNRDEFVERYKGRAPVQSLADRLEAVRACRFVDAAVVNVGDEDSRPVIEVVAPACLAIGSDWLDDQHDERRYFEQLGVTADWMHERKLWVEYIRRTRGTSTTALREAVA